MPLKRWVFPSLCALASAGLAAAAEPAPAPRDLAVTPLRDRGMKPGDAERIEVLLLAALADPRAGFRVVNLDHGRLAVPRRASPESFSDDPLARSLALGGELKVGLVLAVDPARLGDGVVLYLSGTDVGRARPTGSAAYSLGVGEPDRDALVGALVRVLTPERYRGALALHVDVPGVSVLLDGAAAPGGGSAAAIGLDCGTHSLRVTHPAYRDFLRFVTVEFGRTTDVEVALSRFPIDEGELTARVAARKARSAPTEAIPWYRRWWVVTGASVLLVGAATAVAATTTRAAVQADYRAACCQ